MPVVHRQKDVINFCGIFDRPANSSFALEGLLVSLNEHIEDSEVVEILIESSEKVYFSDAISSWHISGHTLPLILVIIVHWFLCHVNVLFQWISSAHVCNVVRDYYFLGQSIFRWSLGKPFTPLYPVYVTFFKYFT